MIPRDKMSRKARREQDKRKRQFWTMNPVTRVKESGKAYRREKNRTETEE